MLSKNRAKELVALHRKRERRLQEKFIAEGPKIVGELLKSDWPVDEIFAESDWLNANVEALNARGVRYTELQEGDLERISALEQPRDVLAVCRFITEKKSQILPGELHLLCDDISDPGNLGTLIRLADWFGISSVLLSSSTVEWTNPKVIQATMGSFLRVQLNVVDKFEFLNQLPTGVPVMAADLEGSAVYGSEVPDQGVLIIGNESRGLDPQLSQFITSRVNIPSFSNSPDKPESLNAAVAAAIIISELRRKKFY